MKTPKTTAEKNRQIRREVKASILLYCAFFLWWYCTGYGIAEMGTPETYTYICGLPLWFFLSSVAGYVLFCFASIFVVKKFFCDFSLQDKENEERA